MRYSLYTSILSSALVRAFLPLFIIGNDLAFEELLGVYLLRITISMLRLLEFPMGCFLLTIDLLIANAEHWSEWVFGSLPGSRLTSSDHQCVIRGLGLQLVSPSIGKSVRYTIEIIWDAISYTYYWILICA